MVVRSQSADKSVVQWRQGDPWGTALGIERPRPECGIIMDAQLMP
jgi:hypothetical protein